MGTTTKTVLGFFLAAAVTAGELVLDICCSRELEVQRHDHMYTTIARRDFAVISCNAWA